MPRRVSISNTGAETVLKNIYALFTGLTAQNAYFYNDVTAGSLVSNGQVYAEGNRSVFHDNNEDPQTVLVMMGF